METALQKIIVSIVAIGALLPLSTEKTAGQISEKIEVSVLEKFSSEETVDVLILFQRQLAPEAISRGIEKSKRGHELHSEMLTIAGESQEAVRSLLHQSETEFQPFYIHNMIRAQCTYSQLLEIAKREEVKQIVYNSPIRIPAPQLAREVQLRSIEWGIQNIKADSVWDVFEVKGENVVIGGQDTGYEWDHPALINQYRGYNPDSTEHDYHWHDAIDTIDPKNSGPNPCGLSIPEPCDDNSHGTHTMGTMVGDDGGGNQIGVAPGAVWIGCRNMERGWGTIASYSECFEWFLAPYAYGDGPEDGDPTLAPHVINNSWSCPEEEGCEPSNFHILDSIVNVLKNAGIVVVSSAGNNGNQCETIDRPTAIYEGAFTVGATTDQDIIASYSSRGPVTIDGSGRRKPEVSAPGSNVRSSVLDGQYGLKSGTSMAAPHVSGTVALLISSNNLLEGEVDSITSIIKTTARQKTTTQTCGNDTAHQHPNNVYGWGIIDAFAAVEEAQNFLDVQLNSFYGLPGKNGNYLYWTTLEERDNSHFEVMRSSDLVNWEQIGTVNGHGTSFEAHDYEFVDRNPMRGKNYYRLKQVDQDGRFHFTKSIVIHQDGAQQPPLRISPNPAHDYISITNPSGNIPRGHLLQITDLMGRLVFETVVNTGQIPLTLPASTYFIRLLSPDGAVLMKEKLIILNRPLH